MAKIKLNLCIISSFGFLLCCLVLAVASSDDSNDSNSSSNPNPTGNPELSLVFERLEAQENRIRELEKSQEECKSLKISYAKSHRELKEQVKTLKKEVDELKNENSVNEDVWLLTPPLRGRRGQKGEKGDSGVIPTNKPAVKKGEQNPVGQLPKGDQSQRISVVVPQPSIKSCSDALEILPSSRSKKQMIYPHGNTTTLEVLCDFEVDGGGWTLIQKRSFGPRDEFNRTWSAYANGFGSLDGNFWMGLDKIHALTKNGDQELRIDLEDFEGNKAFAKYSNFSISDASDFYKLTIGGFSGTAGDSMINRHNQMKFSTKDKGNDNHSGSCAVGYGSGWWFNACFRANLNGLYRNKGDHQTGDGKGIIWFHWKNTYSYSLAKTEMKIRKRK